jgi:hypothetical protein
MAALRDEQAESRSEIPSVDLSKAFQSTSCLCGIGLKGTMPLARS